jgi:hypothetical protein
MTRPSVGKDGEFGEGGAAVEDLLSELPEARDGVAARGGGDDPARVVAEMTRPSVGKEARRRGWPVAGGRETGAGGDTVASGSSAVS